MNVNGIRPNSIPIELDDSLRPLDLISPLDGNLINFLPLSTPPISRSSSTIGLNSKLIGEEMEIKGEEDYPLILVTGKINFFFSFLVVVFFFEIRPHLTSHL